MENQNCKKGLRCAIYIRVSTEEQNLHGLSMPAQKKALTEYAEKNDYEIAGYYADEGISARKPMKYRKDLLRLLRDVENDLIDMILVTKLDRWFRNIKDYNITEEILEKHHCHWKTVFENYDSSTANGQMVINIMLSVNQAECDRTSERIRSVMEYKRSIGEITSGRCACYGYLAKDRRLIKDPSAAFMIEDAYRHYFGCFSIRSTVNYMRDTYKDKSPSPHKIEQLFKNETYAGRHRENTGYCEPYLSAKQWKLIRETASSRQAVKNDSPYLFSSLIKCPLCGNNYTGYRKKRFRKDGSVSITIKYRCGQKYARHSAPHVCEQALERWLLPQIFECLSEETVTISGISPALSKSCISTEPDELNRLNLLFQKGRISEPYYEEQYQILVKQYIAPKPGSAAPDSSAENLPEKNAPSTSFTGTWLALYQTLDRAHKNTFFKTFIRRITICEGAPRTYQVDFSGEKGAAARPSL